MLNVYCAICYVVAACTGALWFLHIIFASVLMWEILHVYCTIIWIFFFLCFPNYISMMNSLYKKKSNPWENSDWCDIFTFSIEKYNFVRSQVKKNFMGTYFFFGLILDFYVQKENSELKKMFTKIHFYDPLQVILPHCFGLRLHKSKNKTI